MLSPTLIALRLKLAVLKAGQTLATTDSAKVVSALQTYVQKGGDLVTNIADAFVAKEFASNPILELLATEFQSQAEQAIQAEIQTLEGEAQSEDEKYLALFGAWLQAQINGVEAQIAAESASAPAALHAEPLAVAATVAVS